MARDPRLAELELKLDELKHQYDLYLSGVRKTEPVKLKADAEREILLLTRFPSSSTMFKFQVKTLAMRFRSLETQVRNLNDLKALRLACAEKQNSENFMQGIVVDADAIDNPAIIAARVKSLLMQAGSQASLPAGMTPDALCAMMVNKARGLVGRNNIKAVRYSLVTGDLGPKVKGEVISSSQETPTN